MGFKNGVKVPDVFGDNSKSKVDSYSWFSVSYLVEGSVEKLYLAIAKYKGLN